MVFPQTPLDVRIELYIGGVWVDVTSDVYAAEKITITRGRADEGSRTDPSKCSLTFNNRLGKYSPRNPLSPYFGKIGRNTPIRVSVPGPTSYLELDGNAANNAATPDTAALDITGDIDIRWEGEADWNQAGAQVLIGKWGEAGNRSYQLRLQDGWVYLHVTTDGTAGFAGGATLPALPRHAALRATLDANNGAGGCTFRLYWAESLAGPWNQIDSDVVILGTLTVFSSSAPLMIAPEQIDSFVTRHAVHGRVYKAEVRSGIDGTVVASPDFTAQTIGAASFTDGAGRTWTVEGGAQITNRRARFVGEVSSWPSRWDVSGKDVRVPVEAAGVLRRYGQGAKALDSTLRRRIPSYRPLAYWPMEEGASASRAYSPITGVRPLTLTGANWAQADTLPSSKALPVLASNLGGLPMMIGTAPAPKGTPTSWLVQFVYRLDTINTTLYTFLRILSTGTVREWYLQWRGDLTRITGKDADGNTVFQTDFATSSDLYNRWTAVRFDASQNGANVDWQLIWTDVGGDSGAVSGSFAGTVGYAYGVASPPDGYSSNLDGLALGHISLWDTWTTTTVSAYKGAIDAWAGETAGARMIRVGSEEGKPVTVYGDIPELEQVGPQRMQTFLDLIEEAADVEGGILLERRDVLGIAYRDRVSLYNQTPALQLDYNAPGHVAPPLEPVDDDQKVRNDVTVTRDGGSSARSTLDTGALSTQAPPAGVGVYDESVTLNLYDDDQPAQHAGWRLHLGTVDEARYPVVNLDLAAAPSLIDAVTALESGDRIQIANPPAWLPPGPIDLIVQGYTEVIGHPIDWDVQLNCTPASPWTVGGTALVEDFSDTDYAITITNGGTLPWARSQVHYNSGTWSLRSGAITNNQTSDAIVSVPDGATELTFWYWTSSEASGSGFEGDRLLVLVDGVQVLRAQGITPWTPATVNVAGASAVTFRYVKDTSTAGGEDAVHIDDLVFTTQAPMRVDADPDTSTIAVASTSTAGQLVVHTPATADNQLPTPWITSAGPAPTYPVEFPYDIRFGGETARVTACVPGAWDSYTRTGTNAWGTADCGFAWVEAGGSASDRSVNGAAGVLTLAASKDQVRFQRIIGGIPDCEALVRVSVDQVATGAGLLPAVLMRYVDASNYYRARVHFNPSGGMAVSVTRDVTTIGATPTLPYTYTAGQWFWLRARLTGHRMQVRVWPDGQLEPGAWHADQTITTSPIPTGQIGLSGSSVLTNTNTNPQLRYDDYTIVTPQLMTVQRSQNGIVKAHAIGTEVRLARPAVTAL